MEAREKMIENYVEGYNAFDVQKMISDFSAEVVFENVQNGTITMTLQGIAAFTEQAEAAKHFFTHRQQTVLSFQHSPQATEVEIDYSGMLAIDLPNGWQKGQAIKMQGKSIFEFTAGKIVKLTDIS